MTERKSLPLLERKYKAYGTDTNIGKTNVATLTHNFTMIFVVLQKIKKARELYNLLKFS